VERESRPHERGRFSQRREFIRSDDRAAQNLSLDAFVCANHLSVRSARRYSRESSFAAGALLLHRKHRPGLGRKKAGTMRSRDAADGEPRETRKRTVHRDGAKAAASTRSPSASARRPRAAAASSRSSRSAPRRRSTRNSSRASRTFSARMIVDTLEVSSWRSTSPPA
jgi:hypothetical protein